LKQDERGENAMGLFSWLQKEWQNWQEIRDKPAPNPDEEKKAEILIEWLKGSDRTQRKLGNEVIQSICYSWEGYFTPSFVELVLNGLQDNAFVNFLPDIRHLAELSAHSDDQKRVQSAAQECIAFMEIKEKEQEMAETLLRPSSSVQINGEELLRPAQGENKMIRPDEMLRHSQEKHKPDP
jgi:hypothetical protein